MGENSKIEWTDRSDWEPMIEDRLTLPLKWRKPANIFVNSAFDLFHESAPDEWIDRVFAVMALAPQHTFQILTKHSKRMRLWASGDRDRLIARRCVDMMIAKTVKPDNDWPVESVGDVDFPDDLKLRVWPLPNVWLGVPCEDQSRADERIPDLLETPAAVRFVSAEPLLAPIKMRHRYRSGGYDNWLEGERWFEGCGSINSETIRNLPRLDWVICGGESDPGARPMQADWARSLRDQCAAAGVAFFMKQMSGTSKARMPAIPDDLMIREFPNAAV